MQNSIFIVLMLGSVVLFPILLIGFIVKYRNAKARKREETRQQNFQEAFKGRARIVDFRHAPHGRNKGFELYKVLLEFYSENPACALSAVNVWEVEPSAESSMQLGSFIPVKVNSNNMQQIFPDIPGMRYSYMYQYTSLGIENDFQPVATQPLAPAAPKAKTVYRKRSKIVLFGMPLWEIATNLNRKKYAPCAKARAFVAIGDNAAGLIAVGKIAKGFISIGMCSFGMFSIGGLSIGVFPVGLTSIGIVSLGTIGIGLVAIGGVSLGGISAGLLQFGAYLFGKDFQFPLFGQLFENFKALLGLKWYLFDFVVIASIIGFVILMISFISESLIALMLTPNTNSLHSPRK